MMLSSDVLVVSDPASTPKAGSSLKCGKHGLVEAVLFLYYVSHKPAMSLRSQFVYHQIALDHDLLNATKQGKCDDTGNDSMAILQRQVEKEAADFNFYLDLSLTIPAFITAIVIGTYSDKHGRKIPLFMPCLGAFLGYSVFALVSWLSLPVHFLFIGSVLEGLLGFVQTMRMGAYAYLSDTTSSEKRSFRMLILDTGTVFASTTSLIVVGGTVNKFGFTYPYLGLALLQIPTLLFVAFVLPEIVTKQPNVSRCSCTQLRKMKDLLTQRFVARGRWKIWLLMLAFFFYILSMFSRNLMETPYVLYPPFCWNSWKIALYAALGDLARYTACLVLLYFASKKLQEYWLALISSIFLVTGCTFEAFARTSLMMYLVPVVGFGDGIGPNMYKSMLSKQVSKTDRGTLFACVAMMEIVCHLFGNASNAIYAATLTWFRGFVFLLMAALALVSLAFLCVYISLSRKKIKDDEVLIGRY